MAEVKRIAVVTSHPVQYQVPWLRMLAAEPGIDLTVFYAMVPDAVQQGAEFGVAFEWDVPLLGGYRHVVLHNRAVEPSVVRFDGCDTPEIHARLKEGRFDAVIVNGWVVKTCIQALLACQRLRIPCIVRGEVNGLRPRAAWKRWLHRLLFTRYAAFLAIGSANRRYYLEQGVSPERIFDTPYCVDNQTFADAAARCRQDEGIAALRQSLGLDEERLTLLYAGKLIEKKRVGDVIAAMAQLPEPARERWQLLVVGDGPLRARLEDQARGLPVVFAGFMNQRQMARAYAAADALALASDHGETWGLVVNEAMACGLPAFVSNQVGCAEDLILPGETGEVFPCGDPSGLAGALARHADGGSLRRMGEQARQRVIGGFHFGRVVEGVRRAVEAAA